nr:pentatricopeptide repeat-containing protein [Tanacetum cinerariifolium]
MVANGGADVRGADEGISGLAVEDLGVADVGEGAKEVNVEEEIRINPDIKLHEIADMVMKKYKCVVSPHQCRNAKGWALNVGEATIGEGLDLPTGNGLTLMSDQHKGLVEAVKDVMPNVEHR